MNKEEQFFEKNSKIRYQIDEKSGEINFSLIDIIESLELSKDSRNYWKVLKSRLKKGHPELVTACNQLKMLSRDGKYYQTDTSTPNNILKIIHSISPERVKEYAQYFDSLERQQEEIKRGMLTEKEKFSTVIINQGEISIDLFLKNNFLIVRAMVAGVLPENIFISANFDKLIIKGTREKPEKNSDQKYHYEELFWGNFSRTITLPKEVDIDRIEAKIHQGLLIIKLPILDKDRTNVIRVKSS